MDQHFDVDSCTTLRDRNNVSGLADFSIATNIELMVNPPSYDYTVEVTHGRDIRQRTLMGHL